MHQGVNKISKSARLCASGTKLSQWVVYAIYYIICVYGGVRDLPININKFNRSIHPWYLSRRVLWANNWRMAIICWVINCNIALYNIGFSWHCRSAPSHYTNGIHSVLDWSSKKRLNTDKPLKYDAPIVQYVYNVMLIIVCNIIFQYKW